MILLRTSSPREAETHYIVKEHFKNTPLLEVPPQTGRTHQDMAAISEILQAKK